MGFVVPDFVSAPLRVYVTQTPVACILYSLRPLRPAPTEPSPTRPKPAQAPGAEASPTEAGHSPGRGGRTEAKAAKPHPAAPARPGPASGRFCGGRPKPPNLRPAASEPAQPKPAPAEAAEPKPRPRNPGGPKQKGPPSVTTRRGTSRARHSCTEHMLFKAQGPDRDTAYRLEEARQLTGSCLSLRPGANLRAEVGARKKLPRPRGRSCRGTAVGESPGRGQAPVGVELEVRDEKTKGSRKKPKVHGGEPKVRDEIITISTKFRPNFQCSRGRTRSSGRNHHDLNQISSEPPKFPGANPNFRTK